MLIHAAYAFRREPPIYVYFPMMMWTPPCMFRFTACCNMDAVKSLSSHLWKIKERGEEDGADENYFLALSREENQRKIKNIPRILKNTGRRPEENCIGSGKTKCSKLGQN